ncbi:hypothetical protein ACYZT8_14410 [Pseudomonas sp. LB3P93]
MSSNELLPTERKSDLKRVATGVMKGTLENLRTGKSYEFLATFIHRDEQQGTLRFHGSMIDPEIPEKYVGVGLQLSSSSEPSGTFLVGDPRILHLSYTRYSDDGSDDYFRAESGKVVLQRGADRNEINGRLDFKTESIDGNQYVADVVYALKGFS